MRVTPAWTADVRSPNSPRATGQRKGAVPRPRPGRTNVICQKTRGRGPREAIVRPRSRAHSGFEVTMRKGRDEDLRDNGCRRKAMSRWHCSAGHPASRRAPKAEAAMPARDRAAAGGRATRIRAARAPPKRDEDSRHRGGQRRGPARAQRQAQGRRRPQGVASVP